MNQIGDKKTGGERNHDATDALDEHAIMPGSQRFVGRDNTLDVDQEIFGLGFPDSLTDQALVCVARLTQ